MSTRSIRVRFIGVLAFALLAASCGSSGSDAADVSTGADIEDTSTTAPLADESADEEPATDEPAGDAPSRIVSLSATATEMLFAIGAGDQVIAADSYSNYPAEAPTTDLSAFEPNLEAIVEYEPDLVVYDFDPGELQAGFDGVGIQALHLPAAATLDDVYAQIADLGIATGHEDEAAALNADMRARIDAIVADVSTDGEPVRIYHELDDSFYSASSSAFIGQLYALLNTTNIADEADTDGYGFPQLNPEYILEADPQLIVVSDDVTYTADDVAARPGWDAIAAVQSDSIVFVDGDVASRWGPRLPEFLETIATALAAVPATVGS